MMGKRFEDGVLSNLPVGSFEPCQLIGVKRYEPSKENLAKWPDMSPSLGFRFLLYKPDDPELHGASAMRFVSESFSKLGKLYEFATDLNDGVEPEEFDLDDFVGRWFRCVVRKKPTGDKLYVTTASPVSAPSGVEDDWSEAKKIVKTKKRAKKAAKKLKKGKKSKSSPPTDDKIDEELQAAATADNEEDDDVPF